MPLTPEEQTREIIEAKYGRAWDTKQLQEDYSVRGFLAPFVSVTRKSDGVKGILQFTHMPRFYFDFTAE
jgi:hypothetical protein